MPKTPRDKALRGEGLAALCAYLKKQRAAASDMADDIAEVLELLDEVKQYVTEAKDFTIPITGWGTDNNIPDYPNYIDISVEDLLATDIVEVTVAPQSAVVARAADFTTTQSYAGRFRLRAANVPTAAITAQYHVTSTVANSA